MLKVLAETDVTSVYLVLMDVIIKERISNSLYIYIR